MAKKYTVSTPVDLNAPVVEDKPRIDTKNIRVEELTIRVVRSPHGVFAKLSSDVRGPLAIAQSVSYRRALRTLLAKARKAGVEGKDLDQAVRRLGQ